MGEVEAAPMIVNFYGRTPYNLGPGWSQESQHTLWTLWMVKLVLIEFILFSQRRGRWVAEIQVIYG